MLEAGPSLANLPTSGSDSMSLRSSNMDLRQLVADWHIANTEEADATGAMLRRG